MNVPDGAVWASIPTIGVCLAWMAKSYILEITGRNQRNGRKHNALSAEEGTDENPVLSMTVRQYREFSDFLVQELNGRYLVANGERFKSVEAKLDGLQSMAEEWSTHFGTLDAKLDAVKDMIKKERAASPSV